MDVQSDLKRCPSCGAGNRAGVEWCGQCHRRFDSAEPEPVAHRHEVHEVREVREVGEVREVREPSRPAEGSAPADAAASDAGVSGTGGPPVRREGESLVWACLTCDAKNPIEASTCARCGSSFASLFKQERIARRRATPRAAHIGSAVLPGLGHWLLGEAAMGLSRTLLYVWTLGVSVALFMGRPRSGAQIVRGIATVFTLSAIAVWLVAFLETGRLAIGNREPLVPPKAVIWLSSVLSGVLFIGLLTTALARR